MEIPRNAREEGREGGGRSLMTPEKIESERSERGNNWDLEVDLDRDLDLDLAAHIQISNLNFNFFFDLLDAIKCLHWTNVKLVQLTMFWVNFMLNNWKKNEVLGQRREPNKCFLCFVSCCLRLSAACKNLCFVFFDIEKKNTHNFACCEWQASKHKQINLRFFESIERRRQMENWRKKL